MTATASVAAVSQMPLFTEPRQSRSEGGALGIERAFDVPFVARLALKEKQIQQNYRPVIAARRYLVPDTTNSL